jgi:hypothetical protein
MLLMPQLHIYKYCCSSFEAVDETLYYTYKLPKLCTDLDDIWVLTIELCTVLNVHLWSMERKVARVLR